MVIIIARYTIVDGVPLHRIVVQKIPYSSTRKGVTTEQAYNRYFWQSYIESLGLARIHIINGRQYQCRVLVYRWGNFGPSEPHHEKRWYSLFPGYAIDGKKLPVRKYGVIATA